MTTVAPAAAAAEPLAELEMLASSDLATPEGAVGDSLSVAVWTVISRLSGVLRGITVAAVLGATYFANTYQFTNSLPNLVFYGLLAGSLFSSILVPALVPHIDAGDTRAAARTAGGLLGVAMVGMLAAVPLAAVGAPLLLRLGALGAAHPAAAASQVHTGTILILLFLPQVPLYAVVGTSTAVMNAHRRFALAAAAPALENLGTIAVLGVSAVLFASAAQEHTVSLPLLLLLGLGTTGAVLLHASAQWWGARRAGVVVVPRAGWRDPAVRATVRRALPAVGQAALAAAQLAALLVAADRIAGGVVAFQLATNFYFLPIAIGATPVALSLVPRLSRMTGPGQAGVFRDIYVRGLAFASFLVLPAAVAYAVLSRPLAEAIAFGHFSSQGGSGLLAAALMGLAPGIIGETLFMVTTYACYARHDTRHPLLGMVIQTVVCAAVIAGSVGMHGPDLLTSLGLGLSAGSVCAAVYLVGHLRRDLPAGGEPALTPLLRTAACSAVMVIPAWAVAEWLDHRLGSPAGHIAAMLAATAVGAGVYFTLQGWLKAPQMAWVAGALRGRRTLDGRGAVNGGTLDGPGAVDGGALDGPGAVSRRALSSQVAARQRVQPLARPRGAHARGGRQRRRSPASAMPRPPRPAPARAGGRRRQHREPRQLWPSARASLHHPRVPETLKHPGVPRQRRFTASTLAAAQSLTANAQATVRRFGARTLTAARRGTATTQTAGRRFGARMLTAARRGTAATQADVRRRAAGGRDAAQGLAATSLAAVQRLRRPANPRPPESTPSTGAVQAYPAQTDQQAATTEPPRVPQVSPAPRTWRVLAEPRTLPVPAALRTLRPSWRGRRLATDIGLLLGCAAIGGLAAVSMKYALAAVVVIGLSGWVWVRPAAAAYMLIFLTPLIVGVNAGSIIPLLRPNEALIVLFGAVLGLRWLVGVRTGDRRWPRLDSVDYSLIALGITSSVVPLLMMEARQRTITHDDLLYCIVIWKLLGEYVIVRTVISTREQAMRCLVLSLASAAAVSGIAILQSLNLFGVPALLAKYYAPLGVTSALSNGRGSSLLALPAAVADLAILNFAIAIAMVIRGYPKRLWLAGLAVLFALGVVAAAEFSTVIGLLFALGALVALTRSGRIVAYAIPVALVGGVLLWPVISIRLAGFQSAYGIPISWITRLSNLRTYFWPTLFSDWNWVLGVRPDSRVVAPDQQYGYVWIESGYTWLLWAGGLPLLASYFAVARSVIRKGWAHARRVDAAGVAGTAIAVTMCSQLFLMLFDPHLTYRGSGDAFFLILALVRVLPSRRSQDAADAAVPARAPREVFA